MDYFFKKINVTVMNNTKYISGFVFIENLNLKFFSNYEYAKLRGRLSDEKKFCQERSGYI